VWVKTHNCLTQTNNAQIQFIVFFFVDMGIFWFKITICINLISFRQPVAQFSAFNGNLVKWINTIVYQRASKNLIWISRHVVKDGLDRTGLDWTEKRGLHESVFYKSRTEFVKQGLDWTGPGKRGLSPCFTNRELRFVKRGMSPCFTNCGLRFVKGGLIHAVNYCRFS
jgi:hypothetical protein